MLDPGESPFNSDDTENKTPPPLSGGLWTDDDLAELVRLVKKFPPGIESRWEKVANFMGRSVAEVTHMAKKVKEDGYRVATSGGSVTPATQEPSKPGKVKTRATVLSPEAEWSQVQQKALEAALMKYPKGGSSDRWDRIAKCVPGKSKVRFIFHKIELFFSFVKNDIFWYGIENINIILKYLQGDVVSCYPLIQLQFCIMAVDPPPTSWPK
jgi:DnaJ family protein C protein 1